MTSFSFDFEQMASGRMFLYMRHGASKDATAGERQLRDRMWNAVASLCQREKIAFFAEPTSPEERKDK